AADIAFDAFAEAYRTLDRLEDPNAFGGFVLHLARDAAATRPRRERELRQSEADRVALLRRTYGPPEDRIGTVSAPEQIPPDLSLVEVVWIATDLTEARDLELVDLHLRLGLTASEISEVVGVDREVAQQMLDRSRQRFATAFGATVLWRYAQPLCSALRADLI